MGSAWGKGVKGGPALREVRKMSSQCSTRAETTWRRKKKNGKSGVMKKDRREQSELFFPDEEYVINVNNV
jgi:hypothetical protein